ncbi:MAG: Uma2 family endonuclease, partial [Vicinamibacterales bacterium]
DWTLPENLLRTPLCRRRADRVIWTGLGRTPNARRDLPSIAIEFVSEGRRNRRRDFEAKREEYEQAGVEEYWVIDRFRREMTVFRRGRPPLIVREGEVYQMPLLPGFELPLARLFAVSDALEQATSDEGDQ